VAQVATQGPELVTHEHVRRRGRRRAREHARGGHTAVVDAEHGLDRLCVREAPAQERVPARYSQTVSGYAGHSSVPRTGSPRPVMNTPSALTPVHEMMRNSSTPTIVIDGWITTPLSGACEMGSSGMSDACSRSITL
jgi:hypothetical protein